MAEMISVREAARRLGVSDTAVHKAIKAGRVRVSSRTGGGRPLLEWPKSQIEYIENSSTSKRSHVGSRGSPVRADDPAPEIKLATSDRMDEQRMPGNYPAEEDGGQRHDDDGNETNYAKSRAVREQYMAKLAKLEFEEKSGKLIEVSKVRDDAFKIGRTIRDGLFNIPDRVSHELAHETDPANIHRKLTAEIRNALEILASAEQE